MTEYKPLTKRTIIDGQEYIVCLKYGTEECRLIHTPNGCSNCPMINIIFKQLNAFEEVYMDDTE